MTSLKFHDLVKSFLGLKGCIKQQGMIFSSDYREIIQPASSVAYVPERDGPDG